MALSKEARDFFVKAGKKGGKRSAAKLAKMNPEERTAMKRRAAQARWSKQKKEKG